VVYKNHETEAGIDSMQIESQVELRMKAWKLVWQSEERCEWDVRPWLNCCLGAQAEFESIAEGKSVNPPIPDITGWAAVSLFDELGFYGLYGALTQLCAPEDRERRIDLMIAQVSRLLAIAPQGCDSETANRIIVLAKSRRQIEARSGFIEPLGLALLGGITEGRIRNLMSGEAARLEASGGKIHFEQARQWLEGRSAYWPSIWQDDEADVTADMIRTPRAADGTVFHPALRRRNGFMIGAKGAEIVVETFELALAALHEMPVPRWRRPNAQGNWGIVKAAGWVEFTRKTLNQMRL